jgi:hypothetical protein
MVALWAAGSLVYNVIVGLNCEGEEAGVADEIGPVGRERQSQFWGSSLIR